MPTLKFKIKGVEFEFLGKEDEIVNFVNRFLGGSVKLPVELEHNSLMATPSAIVSPETKQLIDLSTPSNKEVTAYVTSKPEFSHNLFEIQQHFFGRTFKSRGNGKRMYHRTARQLRMVRKSIEKQFKGEFTETLGAKGLKRFVFRKSVDNVPR
jgi:hypothetical protein